ncbi:MAG: hypothetical protein SAL70_40925 [Scytonema sp. PMC 1070.18]|nr:hypothetical protein [Scytonema sp. PMC 1070.18]
MSNSQVIPFHENPDTFHLPCTPCIPCLPKYINIKVKWYWAIAHYWRNVGARLIELP